jgi:hypothetical protein
MNLDIQAPMELLIKLIDDLPPIIWASVPKSEKCGPRGVSLSTVVF